MKTVKAGWVEAPCTLVKVPGRTLLNTVMKVQRIVRTDVETTFIGTFAWDKDQGDRIKVPNSALVGILRK